MNIGPVQIPKLLKFRTIVGPWTCLPTAQLVVNSLTAKISYCFELFVGGVMNRFRLKPDYP